MPAKYTRAVAEMKREGYSESKAHAIATSKNIGGIKQVRKKEALARKARKRSFHA